MKLKKVFILTTLFLTIQLVFFIRFKLNKDLQIQFIDVGQGDSILITTPNKQLILVDGGPDTNNNLQNVLDSKFFFTSCTISTIVATHPHEDHIKGLSKVLDTCKVENIFLTNTYYESDEYLAFLQKVKAENANVKYVETTDKFTIDNVSFDVLWPSYKILTGDVDLNCTTLKTCTSTKCLQPELYSMLNKNPIKCENPNYVSVVLKVTYNEFDTLLTGDAEDLIQEKIAQLNKMSRIEVLKVPHHGSSDSLDNKVIDKINPLLAIISSGKNNVYKHPHTNVLGAFSDRKVMTLRTDEKGTITIKSDGVKFWVQD